MKIPAIKIDGVSKTFDSLNNTHTKVKALDEVSLDVFQGEILGVLGPNGAGKTTLLNILSTLLLSDEGNVEILGIPVVPRNFYRLRQLINMSSGYPNYPWSLTIEENLNFYGKLYGLNKKERKARIDDLIEMFNLQEFARRRFEELSSGTKQRLSLAKALLNKPQVIFLDEPTLGLDPDIAVKTREIILKIIRDFKVTAILTTHYMQEAEEMCERIAFLKQGRLLRLATPKELKLAHGKDNLEEVFIEIAQSKSIGASIQRPSNQSQSAVLFQKKDSPLNIFQAVTNWLRRCCAFSYRNYLIAIRNIFAYVELVFWPIISLISIGLLGDFLELQEKALAFILTGAIAAGVLQVTQLDVAYSLLYEIWSKSLKHTLLTPVGISEHLFGSWVIGVVRGMAIFIVLGLSAIFLFGFSFPSLPITLIFLLGLFGCSLLLGMIVGILVLLFGQKADITAWMFAYLFMLLCGIYYPIDTLPKALAIIAQWIPITYFLEYFRQSFGFIPLHEHGLIKGFGLIVIYLFLGLLWVKYAFTYARQKGIIVRLSE